MSDEQNEIGFGNKENGFSPKKSLYDKILENKGKDNTDARADTDKSDYADVGDSASGLTSPVEKAATPPPPPPPVDEAAPPPPPPPPVDPVVEKPVKEKKPKSGKRNQRLTALFIVLIVIMLGVIGYLVYTLTVEREEAEEMKFTLELQKDNLTSELNEIYAQYDSLQTNNDSMNVLIEERQDEIRITRLVGGSESYIARPFLYTGACYGFLGGTIAVVFHGVALLLISPLILTLNGFYGDGFVFDFYAPIWFFSTILGACFLGWSGALVATVVQLRQSY